MSPEFGNLARSFRADIDGDGDHAREGAEEDKGHQPPRDMTDAEGVEKSERAVHCRGGMQENFRHPSHHDENENENVIAFQTTADRFKFANFKAGQDQIFGDELSPFTVQHLAVFHHHGHEEMRLEHADARPKSIVEPVTPRLDPEHDPDNDQVEEEDEVGHVAVRKSDRDDRGAAGDGPVGRNIESLPPHHDAAQFPTIKVGHGVNVTWVIDAALQRDGRFVIRTLHDIFSCHGRSLNWITAFPGESNKSSSMAIALPDLLDPKHVDLDLRTRAPEMAIGKIVRLLASNKQIEDAEKFLEQIFARERESPSVVEDGVVFPHARTDLVNKIVLGVGRSRGGIVFANSGRARLIFVIGVPQRLVNDYLICVGALARLLKDDIVRNRLLSADTPEQFVETLRAGTEYTLG